MIRGVSTTTNAAPTNQQQQQQHRSPSPSQYRAQMKGVPVPASSASPIPSSMMTAPRRSVEETTLHQASWQQQHTKLRPTVGRRMSSNDAHLFQQQQVPPGIIMTQQGNNSRKKTTTLPNWNSSTTANIRVSSSSSKRRSSTTDISSSIRQAAEGASIQSSSQQQPQIIRRPSSSQQPRQQQQPHHHPEEPPAPMASNNSNNNMEVSSSREQRPGGRKKTSHDQRKKKKRPPGHIEKDGTPYWMKKLKKKIAKGKIVPTIGGSSHTGVVGGGIDADAGINVVDGTGNTGMDVGVAEIPQQQQQQPPPSPLRKVPIPQQQASSSPAWAAPKLRSTGHRDAVLTGRDIKSQPPLSVLQQPSLMHQDESPYQQQQQQETPPVWLMDHQPPPDTILPPPPQYSSQQQQYSGQQQQQHHDSSMPPPAPRPSSRTSSPWEQLYQQQQQQQQQHYSPQPQYQGQSYQQQQQPPPPQQQYQQQRQVVAQPPPPHQQSQQPQRYSYRAASPVRAATPPLPPKAATAAFTSGASSTINTPPALQHHRNTTVRSASPPVTRRASSASPTPVWAAKPRLRSASASRSPQPKPVPTRPPSWAASPVALKPTGHKHLVQQGLDVLPKHSQQQQQAAAAVVGHQPPEQPFASATRQLVQEMQQVPLKHVPEPVVGKPSGGRILPAGQVQAYPRTANNNANRNMAPPLDTITGLRRVNTEDDEDMDSCSGVSALTEAVVLDMTAFSQQQQEHPPKRSSSKNMLTDLSEHSRSSAATAPSWASGRVQLKTTSRALWDKDETAAAVAGSKEAPIVVEETVTATAKQRTLEPNKHDPKKKDLTTSVTTTLTVTTTSNKPSSHNGQERQKGAVSAAAAAAMTAAAATVRRPSWQRAQSPPNSEDTPFDEAAPTSDMNIGGRTPPRPPRGRTTAARSMPKPPIGSDEQQSISRARSSSPSWAMERPNLRPTGNAGAVSRGIDIKQQQRSSSVTPPRTTAHLVVVPPTEQQETLHNINTTRTNAKPLWSAGRPNLKTTGHADDVLNGVDIKSRSAFSPALTPRSTALQNSLNSLKSPTPADNGTEHDDRHSMPLHAPPSPYRMALRSRPAIAKTDRDLLSDEDDTTREQRNPASTQYTYKISLKKVPTEQKTEFMPEQTHHEQQLNPARTASQSPALPFRKMMLKENAKSGPTGAAGGDNENTNISGSVSFDPSTIQRSASLEETAQRAAATPTMDDAATYASAPVDIQQAEMTVEVSLSKSPVQNLSKPNIGSRTICTPDVLSVPTMETDATSPTKDSAGDAVNADATAGGGEASPPRLMSRAPWGKAPAPRAWTPRSYADVARVEGFLGNSPPPVPSDKPDPVTDDKTSPASATLQETRATSPPRVEKALAVAALSRPVDPPEDDHHYITPNREGFEAPLPQDDVNRSVTAEASFEVTPDSIDITLVINDSNVPGPESKVETTNTNLLQVGLDKDSSPLKSKMHEPHEENRSGETGLTSLSTQHDESTAASQRHPSPIPEDSPVRAKPSEGDEEMEANDIELVLNEQLKRETQKDDRKEKLPSSTPPPPQKKSFAEAAKSPVANSPKKPVTVAKSMPPPINSREVKNDDIDDVDDSVTVDSASQILSSSGSPAKMRTLSPVRSKSPEKEASPVPISPVKSPSQARESSPSRSQSPVRPKKPAHVSMEQTDSHSITSRPEEDLQHLFSAPMVDKLPPNTQEVAASLEPPIVPLVNEKPVTVEKIKPKHCNHCNIEENISDGKNKFKYCGKCRLVKYCTRRCQKKDWKKHKLECCKQIQQDMYT